VTYRPGLVCAVIALLLTGVVTCDGWGKSPNPLPHGALFLPGAQRFVAQDDTDSLALYSTSDGAVLRRFPAPSGVKSIALSPDGTRLLVVEVDDIALWDVEAGERRWSKPPGKSGLWYFTSPAFAQDGRAFVGVGYRPGEDSAYEVALAGSAETGEWFGAVPPGQTDLEVGAPALSPDGTRGLLVGGTDYRQAGHLFTFDVGDGELTDTGVSAFGPVCYSADGRYAVCQDPGLLREGGPRRLRIVSLGEGMAVRDVGEFTYIGRIKPTEDGAFLVTALRRLGADGPAFPVGVRCDPRSGEVQEVWALRGEAKNASNSKHQMSDMDFDVASMRGVYTTFDLKTRVVDLRTGESLLAIDHSKEWWDEFEGRRSLRRSLYWAGGVLVVVGALVAIVWRWRKARRLRPRAPPHPG
jgi:hypothetical protein